MATLDLAAIYEQVLDENRDVYGNLPIPIAKMGYGALDSLVRQQLADQGDRRFDASSYESALRAVIEELLAQPNAVKTLAGQELADAADLLAGDAPSYEAYAQALEDAGDALRARARRDVLNTFRARARRDALLELAELEEKVKSRRGYLADGVQR